MVEEEAGQLPLQVHCHGLLRADRVNTEVVENVPLADLNIKKLILRTLKTRITE